MFCFIFLLDHNVLGAELIAGVCRWCLTIAHIARFKLSCYKPLFYRNSSQHPVQQGMEIDDSLKYNSW